MTDQERQERQGRADQVISQAGFEMHDETDWAFVAVEAAAQAGVDRRTLIRIRELVGLPQQPWETQR